MAQEETLPCTTIVSREGCSTRCSPGRATRKAADGRPTLLRHRPSLPDKRVTGHVYTVDRTSGPQWYVKYRLADGRQVQRKLGPAHTGRGRCPRRPLHGADRREALDAILTDARRGTLAGASTSEATFADAAAEYLRYVGEVRKIDATTLRDYRGVIDGYLLDEFGDQPIEAITPGHDRRLQGDADRRGAGCPTGRSSGT